MIRHIMVTYVHMLMSEEWKQVYSAHVVNGSYVTVISTTATGIESVVVHGIVLCYGASHTIQTVLQLYYGNPEQPFKVYVILT